MKWPTKTDNFMQLFYVLKQDLKFSVQVTQGSSFGFFPLAFSGIVLVGVPSQLVSWNLHHLGHRGFF